ncbi:ATP-binding SpoIIE family protein phosphatase [Marinospirillum perlucidum]|uniref:ATP-binding SpoIIE family protein phosphatase n=1 Tax=Marinospirillum perlucidum TaxID=1982602 RepID=UPI000DF3CC74|nr:SpoIIE family protein phosphatase [Marinospirillum perlucidum]
MNQPVEPDMAYQLLIVAADQELSASLASALKAMDLKVTLASSLEVARQCLDSGHLFDLVLLDETLPEGSGLTLLDHPVFSDQQEVSATAAILLAGREDEQLIEAAAASGISDYLVKPFSFSLLDLKVRSQMKRAALSRRVLDQKIRLERLLDASNREAEMASYVFYNNLLDHVSDTIRGFSRYLNANSDFCGDLILAKASPSGSTFILHADAMGHGLSATMTLLPLVDVFHSMINKGYALPMIVREMNRKLHFKLPPDRFVAASVIELDVLHDQVSIWNGGMPTLYHLDGEGQVVASYPSRHMALGILDNLSFDSDVERFQLEGQGGLFGCSDGLTEQVNAAGESYGIERLLTGLGSASRHSLMTTLIAQLKEFSGVPSFDDDVSLFYVNFPELIYFQDLLYQCNSNNLEQLAIDPFVWELTLQGRQIGEQEVPALCNDYLQDLGFPQPFCQKAFTIISELINNAIEHGLLDLKSALKQDAEGFLEYYVLREQKLQELGADDQVRIRLQWQQASQNPFALLIEIDQSGKGFKAEEVLQQPRTELAGRGLMLIKKLASHLEFQKEGRLALAMLE